ncbi:hypothetical protein B0H19DRAFT_1086422 [Mycena capillaripes]|nr:hypothetical protein B0H19DRAFT_1086422 [Mycena capillaripes]
MGPDPIIPPRDPSLESPADTPQVTPPAQTQPTEPPQEPPHVATRGKDAKRDAQAQVDNGDSANGPVNTRSSAEKGPNPLLVLLYPGQIRSEIAEYTGNPSSTPKAKRTEKKTQAQVKREEARRAQMSLTLETGKSVQTHKYLLGYAMTPVVGQSPGSPKLQPGPLQRPFDQSAVRSLMQLGGDNAENLSRDNYTYAMVHICDETVIDKDSLTKDTAGPFKDVNWLAGAGNTVVYEYAGQHRRAAMGKYNKAILDLMENLQKKMSATKRKDRSSSTYLAMERDLDKLRTRLHEQGRWLVAYYSGRSLPGLKVYKGQPLLIDKLVEDEEGSTMTLALSTNNHTSSTQETPLQHFLNVTATIHRANSDKDRLRRLAFEYAATLQKGVVHTLLTKYPEVVQTFASLHVCEPFAKNSVQPKLLVESKEVVWGVRNHFHRFAGIQLTTGPVHGALDPGYWQLIYIGLDLLPHFEAKQPPSLRRLYDIFDFFNNPDSDFYVDRRTVSETGKLSDIAFSQYLCDKMPYFAQTNSAEWKSAFDLHKEQLKKQLKSWVKHEIDAEPEGSRRARNLDLVIPRLNRVLDEGFLNESPFVPSLPGGIPILCPKFLIAVVDELVKLAPAFSLPIVRISVEANSVMDITRSPSLAVFGSHGIGNQTRSVATLTGLSRCWATSRILENKSSV